MTLTLELTASEEKRLNELALEAGTDPSTYMRGLINVPHSSDTNGRTDRVLATIGRDAPEIGSPREVDLDADVDKAIEYYRANLQDRLEPDHNGDHVAIHLPSGSHEVSRWAGEASRSLRAKHPEGGIIVVHQIGPADSGLVARIRGERPK